MKPYSIGFLAGAVTAALLLAIALLREMSQQSQLQKDPGPIPPEPYDPTDEAGA